MINKLRTLLCEVEEVKKGLMELKFGCLVEYIGEFKQYWNGEYMFVDNMGTGIEVYRQGEMSTTFCKEDYKIIGNPIEERHLRMYLKSLCNDFTMFKYPIWYNQIWVELDNTKPLNDQSDETIKKIVEFLTK